MSNDADVLLSRVQAATEGEYNIERELGRGGMAAVFLARDIALDRRVAIKVMLPDLIDLEGSHERFVIEARTAAHLDHPGIVTVYSVKQREGLLFIVMKFVDGRTLDAILKDDRTLTGPVFASVVAQVADALQFAHSEGIVHRDVKPSNILIDTRGRPVVADFGIAKVITARSITVTGSMIGTPAYMSPEQCRGLPATPASDQYSLGVMAYEMLSRRLPFTGTLFELLHAHGDEPPPPLDDIVSGIDPRTAQIVHRMLEKNPRARFPSLTEVAALFTEVGNAGGRMSNVRATIAALARAPDATRPISRRGAIAYNLAAADTEVTSTPSPALVITPPEPSIEVGESIRLRVSESSGASLGGVRIAWRSEDASIATVDENGVVTGLSVGFAKITASGGAASGRVAVTVNAPRVDTLVVTPQAPDIVADSEIQFVATALDARGTLISGQSVVWTSSEVSVCTVSQQGRANGVAAGRATISAHCGDISGSALVKVRLPSVERVFVDPGDVSIEVEESIKLSATATGPMDRQLTGRTMTWRSTVPTVVTVSSGGAILGVSPGTAAVIATCDGKEGLCSVSVYSQPVVAVRIQPARLQIETGRSLQLQGVGEDRRGRTVNSNGLQWRSDDDRIALVDTSGKVHAVQEGRTQVHAVVGDVMSSIDVTVVARPAALLRVEAHEPRLTIGEFLTLDATVLDADGVPLTTSPLTWLSSDPSVVAVSDAGVCEAKRVGNVRISVATNRVRATTKLNVVATAPVPTKREKDPFTEVGDYSAVPRSGAPAHTRRSKALPIAAGVVLLVVVVAFGVIRGIGSRATTSVVPTNTSLAVVVPSPSDSAAKLVKTETSPLSVPPTAVQGTTVTRSVVAAPGRASVVTPPSIGIVPQKSATLATFKAKDSVINLPRSLAAPSQSKADVPTPKPLASAPPTNSNPGPTATNPPTQQATVTPPSQRPATAAADPSASAGVAAVREIACGNAAGAENALNDALADDPASKLGALYHPRDAADSRAREAFLAGLRDMQRLRATAHSVRNEAFADGCAWVMTLDLSWANAFGQSRRKSGLLRLQLDIVGGRARAKQIFSVSGF